MPCLRAGAPYDCVRISLADLASKECPMRPDQRRRRFLIRSVLAAAGLLAGPTAHAEPMPEHEHEMPPEDQPAVQYPRMHPGRGGPVGSPTDRGKLVPGRRSADLPPVPVEIPDGSTLPWKMVRGAKEYHLVAEHVRQEFLPNQYFDVWGFNGSVPGPAIEAVQGDRVRIVVHNDLPEPTTIHWHGLEVPNAMDGVPGMTQDPIPPGKEFAYEFTLHQDGTYFYHSHGPMQEIMGMAGLFIIHPQEAYSPPVDHDFGLVVHEFAILPQNTIPNSMSMEFNFFTINGRSAPYTTPMVVKLGDRVRVRWMNLSPMDHHPMHLHGHTFWITGSEGGRLPESAWLPGNTVLVAVGQSRDIEFIANNPGDWPFHCHILHHMMNPGYPQDMMGMMSHFSEAERKKLEKPQTRGMRRNWFMGLEAMMTSIRVLPPDLYQQVISGKAEIPPGASVPHGGAGEMPMMHHHH